MFKYEQNEFSFFEGDHVLVGHENGIISLYESLTGSHLGTVGSHLGVFGIQIYPKGN